MTAKTPPDGVRLLNVDALRGFALFGILAVNIWAFADPYYATSASNPNFDGTLDHLVRYVVILLFETKFYLLFSFLFGYSFTLQMAAAERAGEAFVPRMTRRQLGMLAIGLLHGALLYYGEILSTYALLGLILIWKRDWAAQRAVKAAKILIAAVGIAWGGVGVLQLLGGETTTGAPHEAIDKLAAFAGSAGSTLGYHSGHLGETIAAVMILQAPSALAMFFLGYAAGRRQLFANVDRYRALGRKILRRGLPIGLTAAALYAWATNYRTGSGWETAFFGLGQFTAPLLTASYVVGMLALFESHAGKRVIDWLAPMGKIALSNYLLQSLTLGALFTGYGFGLVNRIPPLGVLAITPVIFAGQALLSRWWLRDHIYGPAEWVLRAITIGRKPKWRKDPAVAAL